MWFWRILFLSFLGNIFRGKIPKKLKQKYMDQNQSPWQSVSNVLDKKITGEDTLANQKQPNLLSSQDIVLLEKLVNHLIETVTSLTALVARLKSEPQSLEPLALPTSTALLGSTKKGSVSSVAVLAPISSFNNAARILEGVFDGTRMVGADGEFYPVPPNYASKSKLVEGDLMKLTITSTGAFIYKQIGPIKRARLIGELLKRQDGDTIFYDILARDHVYHVLSAAITYHKGEQGDEVAILVPESGISKWAAVEYIVKKTSF